VTWGEWVLFLSFLTSSQAYALLRQLLLLLVVPPRYRYPSLEHRVSRREGVRRPLLALSPFRTDLLSLLHPLSIYELGLTEAMAHCTSPSALLHSLLTFPCRRRQRSHSVRHRLPRHLLRTLTPPPAIFALLTLVLPQGFGPNTLQLVPSYDCPVSGAHYVKSTYHGEPSRFPFMSSADLLSSSSLRGHHRPQELDLLFRIRLWSRHSASFGCELRLGYEGHALHDEGRCDYRKRSSSLPFSPRLRTDLAFRPQYDYTTSIHFALDGSIFVEVAASGCTFLLLPSAASH
jgi:hypothetical protein